MLLESDLIPFTVTTPVGNESIVLSPHPDDEALGCGGTIRLLLESKKQIKVVFLTSGDKADPSNKLSNIKNKVMVQTPSPLTPSRQGRGELFLVPSPLAGEGKGEGGFHITDYSLLRENEAVKALSVLGISDYEFLRFPDRELDAYYEDALGRLLKIVETYIPDTIYSPSMIELNPDHRTTAALSMKLQKTIMETNTSTLIHDAPPTHPSPSRGEGEGGDDAPSPIPPPRGGRVREGVMPVRLIFYEVTTPLRPNMLIDITSVYNRKKQAIKKYKSQLKLIDYLRHITALNTARSLTVNPAPRPCNRGFLWCGVNGPRYVEAFWCVDKLLSREDITKWLSYQAISGHLPC